MRSITAITKIVFSFEAVSSKVLNELVKFNPKLRTLLSPDQISLIEKSEINIVHGAMGSGKTSLMLSISRNSLSDDELRCKRIVVFTNEAEAIIWASQNGDATVLTQTSELSTEDIMIKAMRMRAEVVIFDEIDIDVERLKVLKRAGIQTFVSVHSVNPAELVENLKDSGATLTHITRESRSSNREYSITKI